MLFMTGTTTEILIEILIETSTANIPDTIQEITETMGDTTEVILGATIDVEIDIEITST